MAKPMMIRSINRRGMWHDFNTTFLLFGGGLWWWLFWIHGVATANAANTIFVPNRTVQQRIDLLTKFMTIKPYWDFETEYGIGYPLTIKPSNEWGFKGCLINHNDTVEAFFDNSIFMYGPKLALGEVCRQDSKLVTWTASSGYVQAMNAGILNRFLYLASNTTCTPYRSASSATNVSVIKAYYQPLICAAGQDYTEARLCLDIDECQEQNECPVNSLCQNKDPGYECHCDSLKGYANQDTGLSLVPKVGGVCVMSLIRLLISNVQATRFDISMSGVTVTEAVLQLYLIDENGAPAIDQQCKFTLTFSSSTQVRNITFEGLNQGTRHKIMLKTSSNKTWSDFIITKCYSEIIGGDETGMPDSVGAVQEEGYIMFNFIDNSMCKDAYSFARGCLDGSANMLSKEVFTPDYYYFSGGKLREKYNPGRQAADNLRISRLQVGQQYAYEIRATSKQEWRISSWARVLHTVRWQASIDGHVTLKPAASHGRGHDGQLYT